MKNKIFKKAIGFILAAVMLMVQMISIVTVSGSAEETAAETSGTFGSITWETVYDETNQKTTLHISGEGGIPTLDELGIESYPWSKYSTLYITIDEGITGIPSNFCGASYVFITAPMSMKRISSGAFYGSIKQGTLTIYSNDCVFEENSFNVYFNGFFKNLVVTAYKSSTANEFAVEQGLMFTSLGDAVYGEYIHDGVTYILHKEYAAVSHYTGNAESIKVLSEIEGLPVTKIDDNVFSGCTALTSVTIPDSVTTIGSGIFEGCTSLKSVTIPDSVTAIGSGIFEGCTSLTDVIFPESMTSITMHMFTGCTSLESITIPDSVTEIGSGAFQDCTSLEVINLPEGITSINSYTFSGCTALTEIGIPDSVEYIHKYAFSGSGLVSVELPANLIMIYEFAFNECNDLEELIITQDLNELDYKMIMNVPAEKIKCNHEIDIVAYERTFYASDEGTDKAIVPECITIMYADTYVNYTSISIGKNLKRFIAPELDTDNYRDIFLKEVHISEENPYLCCENGVIYNKDKTEIIYVLPAYDFEDGIMTIPATVQTISCALVNDSIENFAIEEGNTEFAAVGGVLYDAEEKKLLAYPTGRINTICFISSSTEAISKGAFFRADSNLDIVNIPESVKTIESNAFLASNLDYIIFEHDNNDLIDIAADFEGHFDESDDELVDTDTLYYAHEGSVIETQFPDHFNSLEFTVSGSYGENFAWEIRGLDLIISGTGEMDACNSDSSPWASYPYINLQFKGENIVIPENAFADNRYIYTLDLSGVTEVGDSAFYCCAKLNNITDHNDVIMVGEKAFNETRWIKDMTESEYTKTLGSVLVKHLGTSESAEIPDNITYVADNAFSRCVCKTLYVPREGVFYNSLAFNGTSIEHVRFTGMETDITLDEFREAASLCTQKTLTDASGSTVTGLVIDRSNSIMSLANALSTSPCMENMYEEYCYRIMEGCTEDMTDQQLITVLYDYMNNKVTYGFVYAENPNGEYKIGDTSYELSAGLSHRSTGIILLDSGVCSSYTELVNTYTSLINKEGISDTLKSVEKYGGDHVWNAVGIDTGTEKERWYYLDLSNRTYLIGYQNSMFILNPEMFAYDPELAANSDGTYTVTMHDGTEINIEGNDYVVITEKGDVTGDDCVGINDATAVLTIYAAQGAGNSYSGFTREQISAADIDGDGTVSVADATAILTYYAQNSAGMNPDWDELLNIV